MKGYYFHNTDIRNTRAHVSQILNTVTNMQKGMVVKLVVPRYEGETDLNEIQQNSNIDVMPPVLFLKNLGIKKTGVTAFILFNIPATIFLIKKKLKGEADFIYVRTNLLLPLVVVARIVGIPVFYESHRKPLTSGEQMYDKMLSFFATSIVVISDYLKTYYEKYGKKVLVAHDAVSLQSFNNSLGKEKARNLLGLPQEKRIAVYAGTVSNIKGIPYLVTAAKKLPDFDFLLAGIIAPEFKNAELPSNVKLLGKKDQKEIPALLQAADVLLMPHPKGEYSQSPMKLFEYMATGVPIVASRLPSVCEVLNDTNAVLVEPEDADALSQGIEKVFSNKSSSQKIVNQALSDVREHTWEKRGESIAEFIKTQLKK